tara:strand:- start:4192 stop:5643 length:1452 start_codon:yes stop_codon:yes gene_type:complete
MTVSFSISSKIFRLLIILLISSFTVISCKKSNVEHKSLFDVPLGTSVIPYIQVFTEEIIQNEPKIPGVMDIYIEESHVFSSTIGIEYRGSTSYRLSDKKSFGIELWDESNDGYDAQILGFPEEEDWIFMGHVFRAADNRVFDPSLMHHYLGYQLYRSMGNYASRSRYVELEVNNSYEGVYVFMEKLKRDSNRIDINKLKPSENEGEDLTGGYILKIDKTSGGDVATDQSLSYYENNWGDDSSYSEALSFRSQYDVLGGSLTSEPFGPKQPLETYFLYEYPKNDDITPQQKEYIQNYIHGFETALLTDDFSTEERSYIDFIDLDSFLDYFILNELTGNVDAYRLSTYMHKEKSGPLKMGPVWDLNIGYDRQYRVPNTDWIANYNNHVTDDTWMVPFWWPRLLKDPQFQAALQARWIELRSNILSNTSVLGLVSETSEFLITNGGIDRNYKKWTGVDVNYNNAVSELESYLEARLSWMDLTIGSF